VKILYPMEVARDAVAPAGDRPATALLLDSPDARLVTFRLAPGQVVAPHRSSSTVLLFVLAGSGMLSGEEGAEPGERPCTAGDLVAYEPNELHGMRATDSALVLLAAITPRPGAR
jgi:quercetin dioxygenase-like cupin family protein